jgi:endogenous inhibitor of DNA gyrase (YacG/DUF329 family)
MPRKAVPCPICKTPSPPEALAHPFCSERCRLIDLGQWLGGRYRIPGEPSREPSEDPED